MNEEEKKRDDQNVGYESEINETIGSETNFTKEMITNH